MRAAALLPTMLLATAAVLDLHACSVRRRASAPPVEPAASQAFAEARAALRAEDAADARTAAERALAAAPDWVAPRRLLDDLDRDDLLGAEVLARRLEELDERPLDAALNYLVGRLEGREGIPRFELATRLAPDLAWARHGAAWTRFQGGDARGALADGELALAGARDGWERVQFGTALARYQLAAGREKAALETLRELSLDPGLREPERREAEAWLARAELASSSEARAARGHQRALGLIAEAELSDADLRELVLAITGATRPAGRERLVDELDFALAQRSSPQRERLRAELCFERGAVAMALALWRRAADGTLEDPLDDPLLRAARFAVGDARGAVEHWLETQPRLVLDAHGVPRDPRLARVVAAARAGDGPDERAALGEALIAAGWFLEARGLASSLASTSLEDALALDERAVAGLALLQGIERLLRAIDRGERYAGPWSAGADAAAAEGSRGRRVEDVDDLLVALAPLFERYEPSAGAPLDLARSPRLDYGAFADVIHPGPVYSAQDEAAGLGSAGEPVPGLARALADLGRFGIFGGALGDAGPDGTLLRVLYVEERVGEHLGVPFSGTVVWCDGTDVPSRPARRGARITGAALHEGYWIDVEGVRRELVRWRALERALRESPAKADAALAGRGPRIRAPGGAGPGDRRRLYASLGEGDRIRAAVLRDRAGGSVGLDDLLRVTAAHEEGHLCDRSRFVPLSKNPLGALGLLFQAGLSPSGVAELLEYRAQLVAICVAPDPRLPLADCVDALEGAGATPHGAAYRDLLADFLAVLDRERERFPSLHADRFLLHQLHWLGPEDVRTVARRLARDRGVARDER